MKKTTVATVGRVLAFVALAAGAGLAGIDCGGSDPLTKGSFCSQIGAATCDRALVCTLITSAEKGLCTSEFQSACCTSDSSCGDKPADASQEMVLRQVLTSCKAAFKTFDCAHLDMGNAPAECTTVAASTAALSSSAGSSNVAAAGAKASRAFSASR